MARRAPGGWVGGGEERSANLLDTILDLGRQLLLGAQQALPDLIPDAAPLEEGIQRLFAGADVDDSVDVLGAAGEEGRAEEAVGHL